MPISQTAAGPIHFTHNGVRANGPHFVLIHGAGGETRVWPATWRHTAAAASTIGLSITADRSRMTNYSIYAIDLPGHGASPGPAKQSIDDLGDVVAAFIDLEDLDDVIVVGHSMGGAIALNLAARRLPQVVSQVIVASAARIAVSDDILSGLETDFENTVGFIVKYSFDRASGPFFPGKARAYTLAAGPAATHADFLACAAFDMRGDLGDIELPTLVIASKNDRMIPLKFSAALAAALPNAEIVSIPDCGHYPHLDRTTLVERAIAGFAARF